MCKGNANLIIQGKRIIKLAQKKEDALNTQFKNTILITVDVEDWFQVENFKPYISFADWTDKEIRVEKNTYSLLDFFAKSKIKATFFILGWIAERIPQLVQAIHSQGHEVASHGYNHKLCLQQPTKDLKKDLVTSKNLLESIINFPVYGYRAPSFSINNNTLQLIEECGYLYDSSFNSFGMNKRYGQIDSPSNDKKGIASQFSDSLYELPISNIKFGKRIFPWGGGGYFRLIPLPLFNKGVQYILKKEQAYLFYLHPWEIDLKQPIVKEASKLFKFRHYVNLDKTLSKLSTLIQSLKQCQFTTCYQYLESLNLTPNTQ